MEPFPRPYATPWGWYWAVSKFCYYYYSCKKPGKELTFSIIKSERAFGNGCVKGWQILCFVVNDLRDGWTNLGETFRDCQGWAGEWPRERTFPKIEKLKSLQFWQALRHSRPAAVPKATDQNKTSSSVFLDIARFWYLVPCTNIYLIEKLLVVKLHCTAQL